MQWQVLLLASAISALAAGTSKDTISRIEYYGYEGIDLHKVQRAMHVKPGRKANYLTVATVEEDVRKALGADAADVTMVCCDRNGGFVIYVGLPGKSIRELSFRDLPTEELRLPEDLTDLVEQIESAIQVAVKRGGESAQEDDSAGFALQGDPTARALQLRLHELAVKEEPSIQRVLRGSSIVDQRAVAAMALGYSHRSPEQIAALVDACRDSADLVRNNAARALAVLMHSNAEVAAQVPASLFIDMLNSPLWTDRNKAGLVLLELTKGRDSAVINELRAKASTALVEMAQWQDEGHAYFARVLLARVAGIPEAQIDALATNKQAAGIIQAARPN